MVHEGGKGADITVPVVTLDDQLKDMPFIEVLKIDTEGADTWVLEGATSLLRQKRIRHVFFEENRQRMAQLDIKQGAAAEILRDTGYSVKVLDGGGSSDLTDYAASIVR